jgi:putative DNA primase/helicase
VTALRIPDITEDMDTLAAALAYAEAGFYIVPTDPQINGKNPGSVVGKDWPTMSSRDPKVIVSWYTAKDYGIALHCGRSGAVVFDVDRIAQVPKMMAGHLDTAPHQSSRPDDPGRGHYLFLQPPGRDIGNGTGQLGGAWGEVRGRNGVIIAAPSHHTEGGEYRWFRGGLIPVLPDELADKLPDANPKAEDTATDAEVQAFIAAHTEATRPGIEKGRVHGLAAKIEAKESRHACTIPFLTGALAEARCGFYSAQAAIDAIKPVFMAAVQIGENKRTEAAAASEFAGILAWAVAQAKTTDLGPVRARVEKEFPPNATEATAEDINATRPDTDPTGGVKPESVVLVGERINHSGHLGMAYKMGRQFRDKLLYVNGIGWHRWDGKRWARDGNGAARRAVHTVIKREWIACADMPATERDERAKQISRYESASAITGILTEAAALEVFSVTVNDLDADPYLLNTANGTFDCHTFKLRPASPADRITKVCRGAYHPGASAQTWAAFLTRSLPDEPVRKFVQRLTGLALLGEVREHLLPIFTGEGANGKSTFYEAVLHNLGDYGCVAEPELFTHRENAHPTGQMDLMGRRLAVVSETDEGKRLAEATMKRLTGGDPITARYMRENNVTFTPSHLPILVTNHLPKVSGDSPSVWRRIRVVDWTVVIPADEQDKELSRKLQLEADGILAWCVEGLRDYLDGGLAEPDSVIKSTSRYRADSDAVARFVSEECHEADAVKIAAGDLFDAWDRWRKIEDAAEISKRAFGQALSRRGYASSDSNGRRWWNGICVLKSEEQ